MKPQVSRPRRLRVATIVLAAELVGCAAAPTEQIQYFSKAFDAVNTVAQPMLDDLAVAERQQGRSNAEAGASCPHPIITAGGNSVVLGFCNADAVYFSDSGDPPATRAFRGGLTVLHGYIELLVSLANGQSASDAVSQVNLLGQQVTELIGAVGGGAATAGIAAALGAFQPLLKDAANQLSVQEVRRVVLDGDPEVTGLIAALTSSAPRVFDTVTRATQIRLGIRNSPTFASDKAKYETYRTIVSNYVELLGQLGSAWTQTVAAVNAPSALSLAVVANRVGQLQANSAAILRLYAVLRTGAAPTNP